MAQGPTPAPPRQGAPASAAAPKPAPTPASVAPRGDVRRAATARPAGASTGAPTGEEMTGAQSIVRSLEEAGAEVVFGIPGGAILPTYDPLMDSQRLRHILVRHEQGAATRRRATPTRPAASASRWRRRARARRTW